MTLAVVLAVLGAGFAARTVSVRLARTTSDLFTAIRPPSAALVGAGLAAEHLSGPAVVAVVLVGAGAGAAGAWLSVALVAGLVALTSVAAAQVRRSGVTTPGDIAAALWDDRGLAGRLHRATLVAAALFLVPVIQVAGRLVEALVPVPYPLAAAVAGAALLGAVLAYRGRGSLYAQPVRLAALAGGLAAALVLAPTGRALPGLGPPPDPVAAVPAISLAAAIVVGTLAAPQLWSRLQAASGPDEARRAVVVAALAAAVLATAALAAGASQSRLAAGTAPGPADRLWLGVVIGGLLSGCLAAGSGLLLAASATARRLGAGPFGTWVATTAAAVGLAVAWRGIGLVTVVGWGFAFAAATLSPVVLAGLWWRPASPEGVRWGAATGAALTACSIAAVWAGAAPSGWQPLVAAPGLASIPAALSATALRSLGSPARRTRDPRVAARLHFHRPGRRRARA